MAIKNIILVWGPGRYTNFYILNPLCNGHRFTYIYIYVYKLCVKGVALLVSTAKLGTVLGQHLQLRDFSECM